MHCKAARKYEVHFSAAKRFLITGRKAVIIIYQELIGTCLHYDVGSYGSSDVLKKCTLQWWIRNGVILQEIRRADGHGR